MSMRGMLIAKMSEARKDILDQVEDLRKRKETLEKTILPKLRNEVKSTGEALRKFMDKGGDPGSEDFKKLQDRYERNVVDLTAAKDAFHENSETIGKLMGGLGR